VLRAPSSLTLNFSRAGHLPPLWATCASVSAPSVLVIEAEISVERREATKIRKLEL